MNLMRINILGTEYDVVMTDPADDPKLNGGDGYTDTTIKTIVINDLEASKGDPDTKHDLEYYKRQVLRHEIIHAFLFESGLEGSCDWAVNEEIVDWFAIQIPKICNIMKQGGLL